MILLGQWIRPLHTSLITVKPANPRETCFYENGHKIIVNLQRLLSRERYLWIFLLEEQSRSWWIPSNWPNDGNQNPSMELNSLGKNNIDGFKNQSVFLLLTSAIVWNIVIDSRKQTARWELLRYANVVSFDCDILRGVGTQWKRASLNGGD